MISIGLLLPQLDRGRVGRLVRDDLLEVLIDIVS